jgi:hypothetical protein
MPKKNNRGVCGLRPMAARNLMTHAEIIRLKNDKKKKKENQKKTKEYHLREYMKLTDNKEVSKKSVARSIMDHIEEVKESLTSEIYRNIMDQLMSLHKEGDNSSVSRPHGEDDYRDNRLTGSRVDYGFTATGSGSAFTMTDTGGGFTDQITIQNVLNYIPVSRGEIGNSYLRSLLNN